MIPKIETFKRIEADFGCNPILPEKEYFLMQVIKRLTENLSFSEGRLVFGGGTSLARAYKVMKRFSEDGDFRFVPNALLASTKQIRKKLTNFIESLDGFELSEKPENDSSRIKFKLDYAKHSEFTKSSALRPYIQVEIFFSDALRYPVERKAISSLYNEYEGLEPETELDCVAMEETAIDKISSLLWRIGSDDDYHPADMRHLHDLAILSDKLTIDEKFIQTLTAVHNKDMKNRTKDSKDLRKNIEDTVAVLSNRKSYNTDYKNYVMAMSYAPDSENLSFEQALAKFDYIAKRLV